MVNLDIYLWEETCLIYQKEKPSLIPIENFSETDIIKMIQSLTRYWILKQNDLLLAQSFKFIQLYRWYIFTDYLKVYWLF
jgi:hypothetical protein